MDTLKIPGAFARQVPEAFGPEGAEWLASLPDLAAAYARRWELRFEGEPMHGYVAVVQPARRADGTPVVLKLSWQDDESRDEPLALSTWAGRGAVLLLDNAPADGVLLLERLDASRMLDTEPLEYAIEVAGGLARRLAVPAPPELSRDLRTEAARLVEELPSTWRSLGEPFPRHFVDAAVSVCRELGPSAARLLVNEDLHYENVLAGSREPWLVIDPKPLAGDLEFGVIPLLWNRFEESTVDDRMAAVVAAAGLDAGKARAWTLVRAVENWLWLLDDWDDDSPVAAVPEIARWAAAGA
ncbi:aminoglycoside phosphotransferase family protein [Amycolatopsis sp. H20-H5]|uniref:aminoglycoside phosphotransferase family protein n=1 Tax=Amycolatopsis sp. H20-H5 TaxID=3046309 RepID=UPI002DB872D1|nr:aminoglycoside phosphotransferase family protein [Amycolatopsis sp. H20-H5]MEC3979715.1 aminoglycoside phosphotransferase family protein [Amycolatopsis sp. H20-H5]